MRALMLNHYSNKATYNPAAVIADVDRSFASNADDALLTYPARITTTRISWGRTRNNITSYRQTQFVVNLMNGTQFGGVVDPRMSRMLSPSPDGQYRGSTSTSSASARSPRRSSPTISSGYAGNGGAGSPSRYIFDDKAKIPLMTYAQLQFIKAEAALKMGDQATALTAYTKGISAHIDFVNARNLDNNQSPTQITAAEKAAFLADPSIVPAPAA